MKIPKLSNSRAEKERPGVAGWQGDPAQRPPRGDGTRGPGRAGHKHARTSGSSPSNKNRPRPGLSAFPLSRLSRGRCRSPCLHRPGESSPPHGNRVPPNGENLARVSLTNRGIPGRDAHQRVWHVSCSLKCLAVRCRSRRLPDRSAALAACRQRRATDRFDFRCFRSRPAAILAAWGGNARRSRNFRVILTGRYTSPNTRRA